MGNRSVNLDEAKLAAAEGDTPEATIGGKTYQLPVELPIDVVIDIKNEDVAAVLRTLFGDHADEVRKAGFSVQDLDRVARGAYGLSQGESEASAG